jgi:hypothetical protein
MKKHLDQSARNRMSDSFEKLLMFLRARWRWVRGRCPECNRNVYSTFPYYMADHPNCPVCKDETITDLRMWHNHRALGVAKRTATAGVKA